MTMSAKVIGAAAMMRPGLNMLAFVDTICLQEGRREDLLERYFSRGGLSSVVGRFSHTDRHFE